MNEFTSDTQIHTKTQQKIKKDRHKHKYRIKHRMKIYMQSVRYGLYIVIKFT